MKYNTQLVNVGKFGGGIVLGGLFGLNLNPAYSFAFRLHLSQPLRNEYRSQDRSYFKMLKIIPVGIKNRLDYLFFVNIYSENQENSQ